MKKFLERVVRRGLGKAATASGLRDRLAGIDHILIDIREMLAHQDARTSDALQQLHALGQQHAEMRRHVAATFDELAAAREISAQAVQMLRAMQTQLDEVQQHCAHDLAGANKAAQVLLSLNYRERLGAGAAAPSFDDIEYRCFSQTGEDGILQYIFSLIGTTDKRCVEVCAGDGIECNTANLIVNHGWRGLLFDGDEALIARGREFYANSRDTFITPPTLVAAWITAATINALVSQHGWSGDIDLFSLDMDGVDYWIWRSLDVIRPRVVVVEFQSYWGPERAVTIPYREDWRYTFTQEPQYYLGASLPAFTKLGREKGYRLVGANREGFNAFFIRDGIGEDVLPALSPAMCFARHPRLQYWSPALIPDMEGRGWVWEEV